MASTAISIQAYFIAFQTKAEQWFSSRLPDLEERLTFFNALQSSQWFESASWEDFQHMGMYLATFRKHPLARSRALGKQNHPLHHYKEHFISLLFSANNLKERVDNFIKHMRGFHLSATSELLFMIFPDQYLCASRKNLTSLEKLDMFLGHSFKGSPGEKLKELQEVQKRLQFSYLTLVGKRTSLPLFVEIDQYLAFVSEYYETLIEDWESPVIMEETSKIFPLSVKRYQENVPAPTQASHLDAHTISSSPRSICTSPYYSFDQLAKEAFAEEEELHNILWLLEKKKNVVLEGAPGVGKSFLAKRLAKVFLGNKFDGNCTTIQLHPSYSYEDFIQGFRPKADGTFVLKEGIFYAFCQRAIKHPDEPFIFIIEELNRGNVASVFGEMLQLLETDKRGVGHAITLTYAENDQSTFYIPENVFLLCTMNTADRSVGTLDAAIRRRFAFANIHPNFGEKFRNLLVKKGVSNLLAQHISREMISINKELGKKLDIGSNSILGHSYFLNSTIISSENEEQLWFERVVTYEIQPLLQLYLHHHREMVHRYVSSLLSFPGPEASLAQQNSP